MPALRLLGDAALGKTDFAARMRSAMSFWYFCSSLQQRCVLPVCQANLAASLMGTVGTQAHHFRRTGLES